MRNRLEMPAFNYIKQHCHSHLPCKRCLGEICHHNGAFLRTELVSVCIISVRAQSCGHYRDCRHLLVSPLSAGGWLHQFLTALMEEVFPFSHSPVPFLGLQLLVVPPWPASTSFSCSGTTLSPVFQWGLGSPLSHIFSVWSDSYDGRTLPQVLWFALWWKLFFPS